MGTHCFGAWEMGPWGHYVALEHGNGKWEMGPECLQTELFVPSSNRGEREKRTKVLHQEAAEDTAICQDAWLLGLTCVGHVERQHIWIAI